ncbi:MAG: LCP family protein, partial [Coriobacteriia bacterium]|nr:LCP family protein [Coriobacteriia bacterium]
MSRRSKNNSTKNRGSGRDRMRYERSFDGGSAKSGSRRSSPGTEGSAAARISRDAHNAQISSSELSAAKHLEQVPTALLAERDRRKQKMKKRLLAALVVAGALLLVTVAAAGLFYMNLERRMTLPELPVALTNTPRPDPGQPFNIVIFGTDALNPADNDLADTIIVTRIDPQTQEVWMVSIPRDTRVDLGEHGIRKINAAYAFGGPELAIQTVEDVTGQEMDHFLAISFWGFENIVDSLGGIHIDVPFPINDPKADRTPDGSASRIAPGPQILDGSHALTFVRSRDSHVDADIGRTRAQQLFFRALIEQMQDVRVRQLPGLANSLADNVVTSMTPMELLSLADDMRGTDSDDFFATTLPGHWSSPFYYLDEIGSAAIWQAFGVGPFPEEDEEYEEY